MRKFNVYDFLFEANNVEQEDQMENNTAPSSFGGQNQEMVPQNQAQPPEPTQQQVAQEQGQASPFKNIIGSTISDIKWNQKGQDWSLTLKIASSNLPLVISSRGGTVTVSGPVPRDPKTGKQVTVLSTPEQ